MRTTQITTTMGEKTERVTKRYRVRLAAAGGLSALVLLATACGSDGESGGGSGGGNGGSAGQDAGAEQAKQMDCLRGKGMKIEDAKPGQKGAISRGDLTPEQMAQALADCGIRDSSGRGGAGDTGGGGLGRQEKDKYLAYAKCMREEGIDMPDPQFVDGSVKSEVTGAQADPAKYAAADKVCAQKAGF
ncbi:hypothetical protein [Embleya sp. NPDC020886]|uniref:hypothetical protein n=1 Tax=Embleya sp. NPDC020886 TaxID=3363980 RepID=UPI0037AAD1EB